MSLADHLHYLGPALALFVGAGVVMLADLFAERRAPLWGIGLISVVVAFLWTVNHAVAGTEGDAISNTIVVDGFSVFFTFIIVIVTAAVIVAGRDWIAALDRAPEFYALLLVSAGSMAVLVQANDLITIFVALETTSIAQFLLVGILRSDRGAEASLKYLFTGAIAAAVLLYGFAFLFGLSGTTSLDGIAEYVLSEPEAQRIALIFAFVLVAAGIGYKTALAPFHAWTPDVYQGAPPVVGTFLSVASKATGFALVLRVFYTGLGGGETFIAEDWAILFGVLAVLSMIFGNTGALLQTNARRLLGYSSIAQAGNIAVGVAAVAAGSTIGPSAVLFFLAAYTATNLGAFLSVAAISQRLGSDELADYAGLARRAPMITVILSVCLISLTGIPPAAGFIAKIYIFHSAVQTGQEWLIAVVAVAVVNTAISAFYYLRWMRTMWLDDPADETSLASPVPARAVLGLAAVGVLVIGVVPTPLLAAARRAAESLL